MSNEAGTVNSQIIDATTGVVTLLTGQAPSQSFGLLDVVMAETLGMAMYNAVNRQQGASAIGSAAVTAACAKMLSAQSVIVTPPPEPIPPFVMPLPGPVPDPLPEVAVATAYSEAEMAVQVLKAQAASASATSQMAQADLDNLITQAGGTPPAPAATQAVQRPQWEIEIKHAVAEARAAIDVLTERAGDPNAGRAELDTLITEAGGVPPPTPRAIQMHAGPPDAEVADAFAAARSAIRELHALAAGGSAAPSRAARAGLDKVVAHAGGTLPPPPAPAN